MTFAPILTSGLVALLAAAPVLATTGSAAPASPVGAADQGKGERLECKRSRPSTSSRISRSKPVCKTRAEWEADRRSQSDTADRVMLDSATASNRDVMDQPLPP